jgi:hypothetical protein
MISKRSARCAECKHLWDAAMVSGFPISCKNTGRTEAFTFGDVVKQVKEADFQDSNGNKRILENADCPNFKRQLEMHILTNHLVHQREELRKEYMSWPERVGQCLR